MEGCNDHGCLVAKPVGMGTNGRCRCPEWKLHAVIKRTRNENERLKESIKPISHWLNEAVAPNESRIYCRCPVCHQTWHTKGLFSRENHLHWCWVPEFKQKAADGGEED